MRTYPEVMHRLRRLLAGLAVALAVALITVPTASGQSDPAARAAVFAGAGLASFGSLPPSGRFSRVSGIAR